MENLLASLYLESSLLLDELLAWMDGGSVTLKLTDDRGTTFQIEFCQTMSLKKHPLTHTPGSFLFNELEIPIRSESEKLLLTALRNVRFKEAMPIEQQTATRSWIQELINFVESEQYLHVAAAMGRM